MLPLLLVLPLVFGDWSPMNTASVPPARYWHSTATIGTDTYMFGGLTYTDKFVDLNDFWRLSASGWQQLTAVGDVPAPRAYASLTALDDQRLVLFGGKNEPPSETYFGDTWIVTVGQTSAKWVRLDVTPPPARFLHRAAHVDGKVVLFGGVAYRGITVVNDVWSFDGANWTKLMDNSSRSDVPVARQAHSIEPVADGFVLFGGRPNDQKGAYNDVWRFTISSKTWTNLGTNVVAPRAGHATAVINNKMFVFAGSFIERSPPFVEDFHNDLWAFDLSSNTWTLMQDEGPDEPSRPWKRMGHSGVAAFGGLFVFGGYGQFQGVRNDMWLWK